MTSFTHQLFVVSELDRSIAFYESVCGLVLLHRRDREDPAQSVAWVGSPDSGARLILAQGPELERGVGPYGHIGISCPTPEDYQARLGLARQQGIIERDQQSQPWPICDWFSVLDPDGNRVELSFGQDSELP